MPTCRKIMRTGNPRARPTWTAVIALLIGFAMGAPVRAEIEPPATPPVVREIFGMDGITFEPVVQFERLILTVSGPDGRIIRREFKAETFPAIELFDASVSMACPRSASNWRPRAGRATVTASWPDWIHSEPSR